MREVQFVGEIDFEAQGQKAPKKIFSSRTPENFQNLNLHFFNPVKSLISLVDAVF